MGKTAAALGREIDSGALDPRDLTRDLLDAVAAHAHGPRIYARMTEARAMAEAEAAATRAKAGLRLGPLDGVPVSWKDLFDTAGTATEAGTALMRGRVPERDATVLERATARGTICLGKTHMSEIAFSGLGYNPVTDTPPNVNDPEAVPGGSSSGAAASVAFDLAPLAIGSDTGGSVRLPAGWNDLVGFKPTHGALPLTGVVPLCARFDTVGPLARSVEDAALAFAAMGGPQVDLRNTSLAGRRLGVLETIALDDLEDAPAAAFDQAVAALEKAGAEVVRIALPALTEAFTLTATLYPAEGYAFWKPYMDADPEAMFYQIRARITAGADVRAIDYIAAWDRLMVLRAQVAEQIAGLDAILTPTAALMPPKLADIAGDDALYVASNLKALRNTRIGNLMGMCGISLPTGVPSCGLMMMATGGRDGALLRLAAGAERALA